MMRAEVELLRMAARPRLGFEQAGVIEEFIRERAGELDWGFLIDQAFQHKILPLVAHNFLDYHLYPSMTERRLRFRHEMLFRLVADGNAARNEAMLRELGVVLRELDRHGISVVVRKGPVLMQEVYGDTRLRLMNDLDLMLEPGDVGQCCDLLKGLGYSEGKPSRNRRALLSLSRKEQVYQKLKMPNITMWRATGERFVAYHNIDICLNQFLPDSGYDLPAGNLGERARPITLFGSPALAFTPEEMLVDLAVHLFKEATTLQFIASGQDLCLAKFLDIAEHVRRGPAIDWEIFLRRCRKYGIGRPVYFGLHFTDVLYPDVLPTAVLDELRPEALDYLDQFGFADKQIGTWQEDFVTRMFDADRAAHVPESRALL